jgi:hypothetical protein
MYLAASLAQESQMRCFSVGVLVVAALMVGACGQRRTEAWEYRLSDTEVVDTLTDPGDSTRVFEVTRAILPAGVEGPRYPSQSGQAGGKLAWKTWTADHPQAYFGLRLKGGEDFLPPSRPYLFPVGGQGFLFGNYGGERGDEIVASEYIAWDYRAGYTEVSLFYRSGTYEDEAQFGMRHQAKLIPRGPRLEGNAPKVDAVVMVRPNRLQIFSTSPARKPQDIKPREWVSPSEAESHAKWGTQWRKSTARFFRLGASTAYFDDQVLHVCDGAFQTTATVTNAVPQRVYAQHSYRESASSWVDPWFIIKASPKHDQLYWLLQPDGTFQPPPGSLGVIPLEFIVRISGRTDFSYRGGAHENVYRTMCTGWLVASGNDEHRQWALASADFSAVTPPLFKSFEWIVSDERRRWLDYQGPAPRYLALKRIADDQAILLDGTMVPGSLKPGSLKPGPLSQLLAAAEDEQRALNIEERLRADQADAALAQFNAAEKVKWERIYQEAQANHDAWRALRAAQALGREAYWQHLQTHWIDEADLQEALRQVEWSSDQRAQLQVRIQGFEDTRKRLEAAKEADARAVIQRNREIEAARNRSSWAAFREQSAAAASANARAVSDTVYNQQMESYRRGLTDRLPNR